MNKAELEKKSQILYSWSFFYQNSLSSLAVSRYHKVNKNIIDKDTKEPKIIKVNPNVSDEWNRHYGQAIDYSQRFKEDKAKAEILSKEIKQNQNLINDFYKQDRNQRSR